MQNRRKGLFISLMILPQFIVFLIFIVYPSLNGLILSFTEWSGLVAGPVFVGLKNYKTLFTADPIVWQSFMRNIYFLFSVSVPVLIIAMFYSVLIVRLKIKGGGFFRIVSFFPNVLSIVIITILWTFIFNPSLGLVNPALKALGLENLTRAWLGDRQTVKEALTVTMIWPAVGYQMLFYIAGMAAIPPSLYESARIDGAGEVRQFFSITLPLLAEILIISSSLFIIQAFDGTFRYIWVMTSGGPNHSSEILATWLFQKAFRDFNFGYGSAIGTLIFAITLFFALTTRSFLRKRSVEY